MVTFSSGLCLCTVLSLVSTGTYAAPFSPCLGAWLGITVGRGRGEGRWRGEGMV